jgi:hypothetical protein
MAATATDLFNYAVQTFEKTFAQKLREWGLKIYPPRRGDYEIEWLIESKSGYLTRIFIVLYPPYGIGIYEGCVDKAKVRIYDNWKVEVRKRFLEVVGDAILRLSGKEIEKEYNVPYHLLGGVMLLKLPKTADGLYPEMFVYFKIAPKKLRWCWKLIAHHNNRRSEVRVTEKKISEIKDPIEVFRQMFKAMMMEISL